METTRLNIDVPSDDFSYIKMICAKKGISIKEFLLPAIHKLIEEEADILLAEKAQYRLNHLDENDLIPIEEAFKQAGWYDKEVSSDVQQKVRKGSQARSARNAGKNRTRSKKVSK